VGFKLFPYFAAPEAPAVTECADVTECVDVEDVEDDNRSTYEDPYSVALDSFRQRLSQ